jgi:pyruvate kinase
LRHDVKKDSCICTDDGSIELKVNDLDSKQIICAVINGGMLSPNKGINFLGIDVSLPFVNKKNQDDIKFAVKQNFDFIAASFTRSAKDIFLLRSELKKIIAIKFG